MIFSNLYRQQILNNMKHREYDLVVIGGGITGAGIALDATQRGMKVALVEMQDFAAGTSSRSTKLVHGGLRYLKQLQIGVVAETGKERAIVYENGPHVTTPEFMLLPMHKGGTFGPATTSIALKVYDFLADVKKEETRKMLSRTQTIEREPLVKRDGLKGGGYYVEYRTDDARMTIEVMKRAVEMGADVLNYTKSIGFVYNRSNKVIGINAQDMLTNERFELLGRKVVNASGPWVDAVREEDYSKNNKQLRLTKGVHLVFDQSVFPLKQAVYFDTKSDKRMVFAIPRAGKTYVGTTDTFYNQDKAHPKVTQEDRDYVIDAINYMFPTVHVTDRDIESTWAGIRPLILEEGKDPSEISRKDEIWEGDSGLLTIAGGKLTGYRHMAEEIVDRVALRLKEEDGLQFAPCRTKNMTISGGDVGGSKGFEHYKLNLLQNVRDIGLSRKEMEEMISRYGSNAPLLFNIAHAQQGDDINGLPLHVYTELIYSIQHEMVFKPSDFFVRRTGALYFDITFVNQYKEAVVNAMADLLHYTESQKEDYTRELEQLIIEATTPSVQVSVE